MARRRRCSDAGYGYLFLGVPLLAALGAVIDFVKTNQEAILEYGAIIAAIGAVVLVVGGFTKIRQRKLDAIESELNIAFKREALLSRYQDADVVDAIMSGKVKIGMTRDQVIEAWGEPDSIKVTRLATKRKEEFRYNRTGVNRYLSRIYMDNGAVIGWKR